MTQYNHTEIEKKWREHWYRDNIYKAEDFSKKPKKYILAEFPYPSGPALHAGHMMRYTVPDIYSRYLRMRGFNVMFPMGWDAFGLPAEQYAIKTGIQPAITVKSNSEGYKKSMQKIGFGFDWDREINSTDPSYYKWTQWIFLKFFEAGLAEIREEPVWWSEKLKSVLSDEEILTAKDGTKIAERDGSPVEKKLLRQWVLKITEYAEQLLQGLEEIDFPDSVKFAQQNWIGKSKGVNINYKVKNSEHIITCFTTTPTNYAMTFLALAPDHKLINQLTTEDNKEVVELYIKESKNKSDLERLKDDKEKTGVFTGSYAINPFNNEQVPIWVADFVLATVGTGALQGCPGHDSRDFAFAKKYNLPIKRVVIGENGYTGDIENPEHIIEKGTKGVMVNSGPFDGLDFAEAMEKTMDYVVEKGWGQRVINYKLRDWLFSRQRYWGEPIPIIHKQDGTLEAVVHTENPEEVEVKLPLELPDVADYNPTSDGASPLNNNQDWVNTKDSQGNPAKRETNTMPNWAGSSWYYLRYTDPKNTTAFADSKKMEYWLPVDRYFGGSEHTTLHLLYSRFWHKFLYDQNLVPTKEPYAWRMNGGLLLGPDGKKMSKSVGNVVDPMEVAENYGADALRMCISFLGPYEDTYPWNENSIKACWRTIKNIYDLKTKVSDKDSSEKLLKAYNKLVKNAESMYENLKANTAVSEVMIFVNLAKSEENIDKETWKGFIKVIAPMTPFIAEELWQEINEYSEWKAENSIHLQAFPSYNPELLVENFVTIAVQINGKVRTNLEIMFDESELSVKEKVLKDEKVLTYIQDKELKKFIYIPNKIASIQI